MSTTTHPTLARMIERASALGSKAATAKGVLKAVKGRRAPTIRQVTLHPEAARAARIARINPADVTPAYTADVRAEVARRALQDALQAGYPYATPSGSWAGGNVSVVVNIARAGWQGATATTKRAWSSNGKWTGNDLLVQIAVTERALLSGLDMLTGGLVLLDAERVEPGVYRASWVQQSGKLGLKRIDGWLIRGYHSTKKALKAAKAEAAAARERAHQAELADRLAKMAAAQRAAELSAVWVTVSDSIASGNCAAGTDALANRVHQHLAAAGQLGAVRADVLLAISDTFHSRRAVAVAQRRQASHA